MSFRPIVQDPQLARRLLTEQKKWVEDHGGCEAAYIQRYGLPGFSRCYGDGGTEIWKADKAELDRLQIMVDYYDAMRRIE
jgi:hypothetical protein